MIILYTTLNIYGNYDRKTNVVSEKYKENNYRILFNKKIRDRYFKSCLQ